MSIKSLEFQHLNNKMKEYANLYNVAIPPTGWIKAIRKAIGMSMEQLGNKLSISKQGVLDIEKREKEGAITIKALKEIGRALNMQLIYGFVPLDGSLEDLIEKRAREIATKIVLRTSNTMKLEDQGNTNTRIENSINEMTQEIKNKIPKVLWD